MNAIILAAGQGTRLQPLTNSLPKCMVKLFNKSLIEWQIDVFHDCNIDDITIVTGYLSEKIKFENIHYRHNKDFDQTNMIETLFCANDKIHDSTIVSYGDIIFEKNVLQKLIDAKNDIDIIIDKNWEHYWKARFTDPLIDAESLSLDTNENILSIGQNVNLISEICGQFIGLMKFQNEGIDILKSFYEKSKKISENGLNPLNSKLPFKKSYMTDLLNGLINDGNKLKAILIEGGWLELDSIDDYQLYNKMYENDTISEFIALNK